ncbi:hypothetical protein [Asticcacaulis sp.]|uniref:hypothetical protein n=1 Tax=Asticcacaulis sp. TaxID=1872648 RepID=UPI003F7C800A
MTTATKAAKMTPVEVEAIRALGSPARQMDALKNRNAGGRCVIIACGPSLSEYTPEELTGLLKDETVIAIKQAFPYAPGIMDYLLLNTWNYQKYDFSEHRPLVVYEKAAADPKVFGEHDISLNIPRPSELSQQLARARNFDDYTFDAQLDRPWGPGVLYELGFYLGVHLGVKEIVTLGWDVGVKNTTVMPHFYDRPDPRKTKILAQSQAIAGRDERNKFLHDNGVLYNKPRIIPDEVDACAAVSGDWYDWLAGKGIDLKVVSRCSLVDEKIPRIRLEDLA